MTLSRSREIEAETRLRTNKNEKHKSESEFKWMFADVCILTIALFTNAHAQNIYEFAQQKFVKTIMHTK